MTILSDLIYRLEQSGADPVTACEVVAAAFNAGVRSCVFRADMVDRVFGEPLRDKQRTRVSVPIGGGN